MGLRRGRGLLAWPLGTAAPASLMPTAHCRPRFAHAHCPLLRCTAPSTSAKMSKVCLLTPALMRANTALRPATA
jgi:hypothetical protein